MEPKKVLVRVALALLLFSALNHWKDIKTGLVDGISDGGNVVSTK